MVSLSKLICPKSPRWLISVGRKAEARRILARYHGDGDENAPLVLLEWKEYEESVKLDASDKRWYVLFSSLLKTVTYSTTIIGGTIQNL